MSVENFKKFGQLCAEDEKIREKVKAIGVENIDGWIAYSKNELGLEFNKDDMQALAAEIGPTDELSEAQLEQVAGGVLNSIVSAITSVLITTVSMPSPSVIVAPGAVRRW